MLSQHGKWSSKIVLSKLCVEELVWWKSFLITNERIHKSLYVPKPTTTIFSDASGKAYRGIWNNVETQGHFSQDQCDLSINIKELLAIYYTLGAHTPHFRNEVVLLRCDNMTAIYCIEQRGSSNVLHDEITKKIFDLAKKYQFSLQISYIKSYPVCDHTHSDLREGHCTQFAMLPRRLDLFDCNKVAK